MKRTGHTYEIKKRGRPFGAFAGVCAVLLVAFGGGLLLGSLPATPPAGPSAHTSEAGGDVGGQTHTTGEPVVPLSAFIIERASPPDESERQHGVGGPGRSASASVPPAGAAPAPISLLAAATGGSSLHKVLCRYQI